VPRNGGDGETAIGDLEIAVERDAKTSYAWGMARSLGVIAFCLLATTAAYAEPPVSAARSSCEPAVEPSCTAAPGGASVEATEPEVASDPGSEERAFSAELESFARRRAFTERLIAERNAELFERAIARQVRAAKLQRELAERELRLSERAFEDALALHLKKRELTRARATSPSTAPAAPAAPASSPVAP
jgi:hypothetical protein